MSRISHANVFSVGIPVKKTFNFASGSAGKAGEKAGHIFVRLRDDEGAEGWGSCRPVEGWSGESPATVLAALKTKLVPALEGFPVTQKFPPPHGGGEGEAGIAGLHRALSSALPPESSNPIAKSALDMAFYDLVSRRAGLPLREYLGGPSKVAPVALSYTVTAKDAGAAAEDVAQAISQGFGHFNFKAGLKPETDRALARAVARAAPAGAFLWADANQGFDLEGAKAAASFLKDEGISVLEQPLAKTDFEGMRKLRASTDLPLAVDEACVTPEDFKRHLDAGLVNFLVVKITRSGGIHPSLAQIALAKAANLPLLLSGLTDSFLVKAAACQLVSVFGFRGPAALNGSQFLDESALFPAKRDWEKNGSVCLLPGPGIGLAPDLTGLGSLAPS